MTALKEKLKRLIALSGPISVAQYMASCLLDPEHGYYTTQKPFGREGDFITAPEISQMFGELVAVWIATAWRASGTPQGCDIIEIGPGRGTLMKDVLRSLARIAPDMLMDAKAVLIEASPRLQREQAKTLRDARITAQTEWHERLDEARDAPAFIIGNEIFDALPNRQFVKLGSGWHERMVGLDAAGDLAFIAGSRVPAPELPPYQSEAPSTPLPDGTIVEIAPAREALMDMVAARIAAGGGAGLFIDYGYSGPQAGDTLQAVRKHHYDDVLANPGEADITSHVDFTPLMATAKRHGLSGRLMTQGDFLLQLGLLERAGRLGAGKSENEQNELRDAVERLAGPDQMGSLFKVLAVTPAGIAVPPLTREEHRAQRFAD